MAYSDKHHLEKKELAWDSDMSHAAADMADVYAKKRDSTDAIIDSDAMIACLSSVSDGLADKRSAAKASAAMRKDTDQAFGSAQKDDLPLLDDIRTGADDGVARGLFVHAGSMHEQAFEEEIENSMYARAERMGSLERALRNYAELQVNDAELVDDERDAGVQAYAEAKRSAFSIGRSASRKAKRIADKPSSKRRDKAVKRAEAKLARFENKTAMRRQSKAWGQSKWHEGYSKMRVKRLKKKAQKARVLVKPSRWRWLILMASGVGIFALIMLLAVASIAVIGGIGADQNSGGESLSASERKVYLFLKEKGLDDVHAAAIMANIRAESGGECGDDFDTGAIEDGGSGGGHGLCQWTGGRWNGAGGLLEFAASQGKPWTDIDVQLEFFWTEYSANWSGAYTIISGDSPPAGTYVSGSKSGFEAATEVAEATKQFCYGWERAGIPHESKRIRFAHWYLGALSGGGGHSDILSAAYEIAGNATPYVFGGTDIMNGCDCSYFTQWCYAQAGIDIPRQSEAQMNAGRVIPISDAQPGDLLWMYGHIGIYVDENTVVEQTPPYCRITPITYQNWTCAVRFE